HPQVAAAAPVLELSAAIAGAEGAEGAEGAGGALRIVGIDALRAGFISPDLTGVPQDGHMSDVLADDVLFLSPAAQGWLGKRSGDTLVLRAGTGEVRLRVAGPVQRA